MAIIIFLVYICYGPYSSSSTAIKRGYKWTSGGSAGGARTSQTMGRGVTELYNRLRYRFSIWDL